MRWERFRRPEVRVAGVRANVRVVPAAGSRTTTAHRASGTRQIQSGSGTGIAFQVATAGSPHVCDALKEEQGTLGSSLLRLTRSSRVVLVIVRAKANNLS